MVRDGNDGRPAGQHILSSDSVIVSLVSRDIASGVQGQCLLCPGTSPPDSRNIASDVQGHHLREKTLLNPGTPC